ncbi:MAG: efflux RND transporter periplasmic adaptor subunit [Alphaproteobacteria bacterium]
MYEFDARIKTTMTTLASRIDANIAEIHVREGDRVEVGTLLVSLESEVERLRIEALKIDLEREIARSARLTAEKDALEQNLESKIATKLAEIAALRVEYRAIDDRLNLARKNLNRSRLLYDKKLLSPKTLEQDQDSTLEFEGQLKVSAARIRVADRELAQIRASRSDLDVIAAELEISRKTVQKIGVQIREEEEKRRQMFIASPINGVVDNIFKHKGETVNESDPIILLHDPENFWIEANIEESQLRYIEVGQMVEIDIDAYPFDDFTGTVMRVGSVTTAQMAWDAGGYDNAGKAVQRVPVYIRLLDPPEKVTPGMLVEVNIQIFDQVMERLKKLSFR